MQPICFKWYTEILKHFFMWKMIYLIVRKSIRKFYTSNSGLRQTSSDTVKISFLRENDAEFPDNLIVVRNRKHIFDNSPTNWLPFNNKIATSSIHDTSHLLFSEMPETIEHESWYRFHYSIQNIPITHIIWLYFYHKQIRQAEKIRKRNLERYT